MVNLDRPYHFKFFEGCLPNFTFSIPEYIVSYIHYWTQPYLHPCWIIDTEILIGSDSFLL